MFFFRRPNWHWYCIIHNLAVKRNWCNQRDKSPPLRHKEKEMTIRDLMSRIKITNHKIYHYIYISRFVRNLTIPDFLLIKFLLFRFLIFYFSYRTGIVSLRSITFSPRLLFLRRIRKKVKEKKIEIRKREIKGRRTWN